MTVHDDRVVITKSGIYAKSIVLIKLIYMNFTRTGADAHICTSLSMGHLNMGTMRPL